MERLSQNNQGELSHISQGGLWNLTQIKRICLGCADEFTALNLGLATRTHCSKCNEQKMIAQAETQRQAEADAEASRYRGLIKTAAIPPKWRATTFENSDPRLNKGGFRVAKRYAETFSLQSDSLIFYSPGNGTGKTHLGACIANYILHEKKTSVLFKKSRDLMLDIRHTFSDREESEAGVLNEVLSVPLLILDDVGVDQPSDWLKATYWTVFDRRVESQLPMVITTNRPLEAPVGQVALEDRIGLGAVSRLIHLCRGNVIDMTGPDLR